MIALKTLFMLGFVSLSLPATALVIEPIPLPGKLEDIRSEVVPEIEYLLPLGRAKLNRESGLVQPEKKRLIIGELRRDLWQIISELSLSSTQTHLATYFNDQPYEVLYQCESRACGESFSWANDIFNEALLYGDDRKQYLWTFKHKNAETYIVYYLIERPNRRRYLFREVVLVGEQSVAADRVPKASISSDGYEILGPIKFNQGQADFSLIIKNLEQMSLEPHYLFVLHQHQPHPEVDLVKAFQGVLAQSYLSNFKTTTVENLAPRRGAPGPIWVELVDPKWSDQK